jgi:hypothetical protein
VSAVRITKRDAKKAVDQAVAKRGEDYVYDMAANGNHCVYVHEGAPACIVGEVLAQHIDPAELHRLEGLPANTSPIRYSTIRRALEELFDATLTPGAAAFLGDVQVEQDSGVSWGRAVALAKAKA